MIFWLMRGLSRRESLRLLGGIAGSCALPANFILSAGCAGARIVNSAFRPSPELPLTPPGEFYINSNFGTPEVPAVTEWRLHVKGLVDNPLTIDLGWLQQLPAVRRVLTLECIGNIPEGGLISSGEFSGVRLRDVLAEARVSTRAFGVKLMGLDGYPVFLPLSDCLAEEPMLAHSMNGQPLDIEHGAPLRALFPGRYGMFSTKWLDSITLTREQGLWSSFRGVNSVVAGQMNARSRIDYMHNGIGSNRGLRVGEEIIVSGLALAGGRGVAAVELQADGQRIPAELSWNRVQEGGNPFLWTLWRARFTPTRQGAQTLSVYATDLFGDSQSDRAEFPYDSGAVHTVRVVVHA
jgi:DMSO/TMAO reductase YedYZ molybdopterin-dependent catalytic subunit